MAFLPFLLLLFVGTICGSMIVPYMGFFIVEGLGHEPWTISVYAGLQTILVIILNRKFAGRIDAGNSAFPLIGIAATGAFLANATLSVFPSIWTVLTIGILGFGVSSSAVSTMFSVGGNIARQSNIERSRFNAFMRATTSTAWMIGPAVSFFVADQLGSVAVFHVAAVLAVLWIVLWWFVAPRQAADQGDKAGTENKGEFDLKGLKLAAAFVFCLSLAHSLTFTALPLFYVKEVGLPGYAPGTAFSMKTFVEIFAIFSTPYLIRRFGLKMSLMGTSVLAVATIILLASVASYPQMLFAAALEGLYYGLYASLGISFVQSFAEDRPARATALYWNTLMATGILAGPAAGAIAQISNFQTVIYVASAMALLSLLILTASKSKKEA